MLKHNRVGPWPIVDLDQAIVSSDAVMPSVSMHSNLRTYLSSNNLGSSKEAYDTIHEIYANTLALGNQIAYGVCLTPLSTFDTSGLPIYVQMSITCSYFSVEYYEQSVVPFVGYIDSASAPTAGWHANNVLSKYSILPSTASGFGHVGCNSQFVIKDVNSSAINSDDYLCFGILMRARGQSFDIRNTLTTISGRYATGPIATVDET